MRKNIFIIATLATALAVSGCAGWKARKRAEKLVGKEIVLERSGKDHRPKWTRKTFYLKKDNFYASGGYRNGADYSITLRLAKAEALKNMLESIEVKARGEFSTYVEGSNMFPEDLGRFVQDGLAIMVENIRVRGIRQKEIYWEKVLAPELMTPTYNAWILLEISLAEYRRAQVEALKRLLAKSIRERNKDAEKEAKRLLKKLEEAEQTLYQSEPEPEEDWEEETEQEAEEQAEIEKPTSMEL